MASKLTFYSVIKEDESEKSTLTGFCILKYWFFILDGIYLMLDAKRNGSY